MTDLSLDEDELVFYREHGYLIRSVVFAATEIARLRRGVEAAVQSAYDQTRNGRAYVLDGKRFVDVGTMTVQFEPGPGSDTNKAGYGSCPASFSSEKGQNL